jgi:hypothetical protein
MAVLMATTERLEHTTNVVLLELAGVEQLRHTDAKW